MFAAVLLLAALFPVRWASFSEFVSSKVSRSELHRFTCREPVTVVRMMYSDPPGVVNKGRWDWTGILRSQRSGTVDELLQMRLVRAAEELRFREQVPNDSGLLQVGRRTEPMRISNGEGE